MATVARVFLNHVIQYPAKTYLPVMCVADREIVKVPSGYLGITRSAGTFKDGHDFGQRMALEIVKVTVLIFPRDEFPGDLVARHNSLKPMLLGRNGVTDEAEQGHIGRRYRAGSELIKGQARTLVHQGLAVKGEISRKGLSFTCLLYTSDAADE